jgi:N-acetylneuraminic acid mutarotase
VGADGKATKTVFVLSPDSQTGALGQWSVANDLALPEERADAAIAVAVDGVLLIGGRNAAGQPVKTTLKTHLNDKGKLGAWTAEAQLFSPQADATAVIVGDFIWLYGGSDANGPVGAVQRGEFGRSRPRAPCQPRRRQGDRVGRQQQRQPAGRPDECRRLG